MEKRTLLIASVFGLVTFGVVWSCSEKSSDENISIVNGKNHTLESKIDKNVFLEMADSIRVKSNAPDKSTYNLTEEEAREALQPLIEDGGNIRSQIISSINQGTDELTEEELQTLTNMGDLDLALLSVSL